MACGVHAVLFRKEQTSTLSQKVERVSRVGKSVAKNIYWDGIWGVEAMFFLKKQLHYSQIYSSLHCGVYVLSAG